MLSSEALKPLGTRPSRASHRKRGALKWVPTRRPHFTNGEAEAQRKEVTCPGHAYSQSLGLQTGPPPPPSLTGGTRDCESRMGKLSPGKETSVRKVVGEGPRPLLSCLRPVPGASRSSELQQDWLSQRRGRGTSPLPQGQREGRTRRRSEGCVWADWHLLPAPNLPQVPGDLSPRSQGPGPAPDRRCGKQKQLGLVRAGGAGRGEGGVPASPTPAQHRAELSRWTLEIEPP